MKRSLAALFVIATLVASTIAVPAAAADNAEARLQARIERLEGAATLPAEELAAALGELGDHRALETFAFPAAEAAYRRALELAGASPSAQALRADLLLKLGDLYRRLGRFVEAEGLYREALDFFASRYRGPHAGTASVLERIAHVRGKLADPVEARDLLEQAAAATAQTAGVTSVEYAQRLDALGAWYLEQGKTVEAEDLFKRALAIRRLNATHPEDATIVADSFLSLASLHEERGQYNEAAALLRKAVAIREKHFGQDAPAVAAAKQTLGTIELHRGSPAIARQLYEQSLAAFTNRYGEIHPRVSGALLHLGHLEYLLSNVAPAEAATRRALEIERRLYGDRHPDTGVALNNLALIDIDQGRFDDARSHLEAALSIAQQTYGPDHPEVATHLLNLGHLSRHRGDFARSEDLLQQARAIRESRFGPAHPEVAVVWMHLGLVASAANDLPVARRRLLHAAMLLWASDERGPALYSTLAGLREVLTKQNDVESAILAGKWAVNAAQQLRRGLEQATERAFLREKQASYQELAAQLMGAGRIAEAMQVLRLLKDAEYLDFMRGGDPADPATVSASLNRSEQRSEAACKRARSELAPQVAASNAARMQRPQRDAGHTGTGRLLAAVDKAARACDAALVALPRKAVPDSRQAAATARVEDEPRRVAHLGPGAVLLTYLTARDGLHIVVTTATREVERTVAVSEPALTAEVTRFTSAITRQRGDDYVAPARQLFGWLIEPIAADLAAAKATTLLLSLHGVLRYVPFAALNDGQRFLVERYVLALQPGSAIRSAGKTASSTMTVAAFGSTRGTDALAKLPAVKEELAGIVRQTPDERGALPGRRFLDADFTQQALREAATGRHPLVHIATHFVLRWGSDESYLLLGQGTLTMRELRDEKWSFDGVELLTLSACETAVPTDLPGAGRELDALATLVMHRRARSVMATLWSVGDPSTSLLMQAFYRAVAGRDVSKPGALRQAQLALLRPETSAAFAHPFHWAPFVMIGTAP